MPILGKPKMGGEESLSRDLRKTKPISSRPETMERIVSVTYGRTGAGVTPRMIAAA